MKTVVFVDDEPYIREGLHILADWNELGYKTAGEAGDGPAAIELIKRIKPALVICDIRLPVFSGLEVFEHIKKWAETETFTEPPMFLMLSGYNDFEYARRAMRLGAAGYLTKPLDPEELAAEVRRVSGAGCNAPPDDFFNLPYEQVTEAVRYGDEKSITMSVNAFFSMLHSSSVDPSYSEIALCRLADLITHTAAECGVTDEIRVSGLIGPSGLEDTESLALSICLSIMEKRRFDGQKFVSYIYAHCAENLTLQRLSEVFRVSARHISASVKTLTGRKFNDYLSYCRIEAAKRLLSGPNDLKISAVCAAAGFSDYVYFTEKFKELTGMSPSAFKRRYA